MTVWRTWSRSQVACRMLVTVLPVLALLVAPGRPRLPVLALVVAGAALWGVWPELTAGPVVLLLVMGWWAIAVPDPVRPTALVAAAALMAAHLAALLASYAPARAAIDGRLARTWVARGVLSYCPAPLAYAAVVGLDPGRDQPLMWPVALSALVLLVLAVGIRLKDPGTAPSSPQGRPRTVEGTPS